MIWIGMVIALIGLGIIYKVWFPNLHLYRPAFPVEWREFLERNVKFYRHLDVAGKAKFERDVQDVMRRGRIEGIRGYHPDKETRLLVAAGFATIFHALIKRVPTFRDSIIIYPGKSFSEDYRPKSGNIAGMAIAHGPMMLAADSVRCGFDKAQDGFNPVLHELAHYLDFDLTRERIADDTPMGLTPPQFEEWQKVRAKELKKLRRRESPLREYALQADGELFACAVEIFFENPGPLKVKSPELYSLLRSYFKLDPSQIYAKKEQALLP